MHRTKRPGYLVILLILQSPLVRAQDHTDPHTQTLAIVPGGNTQRLKAQYLQKEFKVSTTLAEAIIASVFFEFSSTVSSPDNTRILQATIGGATYQMLEEIALRSRFFDDDAESQPDSRLGPDPGTIKIVFYPSRDDPDGYLYVERSSGPETRQIVIKASTGDGRNAKPTAGPYVLGPPEPHEGNYVWKAALPWEARAAYKHELVKKGITEFISADGHKIRPSELKEKEIVYQHPNDINSTIWRIATGPYGKFAEVFLKYVSREQCRPKKDGTFKKGGPLVKTSEHGQSCVPPADPVADQKSLLSFYRTCPTAKKWADHEAFLRCGVLNSGVEFIYKKVSKELERSLERSKEAHNKERIGKLYINPFGKLAWHLKPTKPTDPQAPENQYFIHTHARQEQLHEINPTPSLGGYSIGASGGCIVISPIDRDRLVKQGILRAGVNVYIMPAKPSQLHDCLKMLVGTDISITRRNGSNPRNKCLNLLENAHKEENRIAQAADAAAESIDSTATSVRDGNGEYSRIEPRPRVKPDAVSDGPFRGSGLAKGYYEATEDANGLVLSFVMSDVADWTDSAKTLTNLYLNHYYESVPAAVVERCMPILQPILPGVLELQAADVRHQELSLRFPAQLRRDVELWLSSFSGAPLRPRLKPPTLARLPE